MSNRVEEIVREGLKKLDLYYSTARPVKRKCEHFGCPKMLDPGSGKYCKKHRKEAKAPRFLIGKYDPSREGAVAPPRSSATKVIMRGFSSKQIIHEVFVLTGNKIMVSDRSKKDVMRHAKVILEKNNYEAIF